jgi:RNA polymerase sigma-19 factor, ECF subfamily
MQQLHDLQKKVAIGDQQAFTELYQHFAKRLLHFAKAIVRIKESSEEIVEDVFVRLWRNRQQINEIENLTVYLYVSVKNASLNLLSQKAKEMTVTPFDGLDIEVDALTLNPYELMVTEEMLHRMRDAIDSLPPRCKMIFKLVREDGLKYKEIAGILNISVNTIDSQMAIAVKRICAALGVNKSTKSPHLARQDSSKK